MTINSDWWYININLHMSKVLSTRNYSILNILISHKYWVTDCKLQIQENQNNEILFFLLQLCTYILRRKHIQNCLSLHFSPVKSTCPSLDHYWLPIYDQAHLTLWQNNVTLLLLYTHPLALMKLTETRLKMKWNPEIDASQFILNGIV